jgi:hypothetical protein
MGNFFKGMDEVVKQTTLEPKPWASWVAAIWN